MSKEHSDIDLLRAYTAVSGDVPDDNQIAELIGELRRLLAVPPKDAKSVIGQWADWPETPMGSAAEWSRLLRRALARKRRRT